MGVGLNGWSYTRKSFILILNCNGSEPDQVSDLKTDSGTVLKFSGNSK